MFPLPPVVVDADVLIRNVDYAARRGRSGALLGNASRHYTLLSGVVLFATTTVCEEALRHLPEIAERRQVSEDLVRSIWNDLIIPSIRFVALEPGTIYDPRVEGVPLHDRPTAELLALLSPAVLATDNRKHFRSFGLPETKTDEIAIDLFSLGQFTIGAKGTAFVPTLGGAILIERSKKLTSKIGNELSIIVGLLAIGALGYFMTRSPGRVVREKLASTAREAAPLIAQQLAAAAQASERIETFASGQVGDRGALGLIARNLAIGQTEMSTFEVSELLRLRGFVFSGDREHRTATRSWLESEPCFHELARGRWTLGCHMEKLAGVLRP
jgi:hypothetical protein